MLEGTSAWKSVVVVIAIDWSLVSSDDDERVGGDTPYRFSDSRHVTLSFKWFDFHFETADGPDFHLGLEQSFKTRFFTLMYCNKIIVSNFTTKI